MAPHMQGNVNHPVSLNVPIVHVSTRNTDNLLLSQAKTVSDEGTNMAEGRSFRTKNS